MTMGTSCHFTSISRFGQKIHLIKVLPLAISFILKIIVEYFKLPIEIYCPFFFSFFLFFSISHSLVVSQACSVMHLGDSNLINRVWPSLGVTESVGVIAARLFKWDSCSVHNYRFILTDLFCKKFYEQEFSWANPPWFSVGLVRQFLASGVVFQMSGH